MYDESRRSLLKAIASLPFVSVPALGQSHSGVSVVPAGADRTGEAHKAARADTHLDFKVLTTETNGRLFVMENRNMLRGGPPRHIHFEQEEWFYLVEGSAVVLEVGDKKVRLTPGDSVLAPRAVPHVWAYLGPEPGRMLFAFTPAARIEDFFVQQSRPGAKVGDPRVFEAHGMKVVGPPLLESS